MTRRSAYTLFWILGWVVGLEAQTWRWTTYSSMAQIQAAVAVDSTIWCATGGGLLAFDTGKRSYQSWTNTEGLASVMVSAIAVDSEKRIFIGHQNGIIQRFDPNTSTWEQLDDYSGHAVQCLLSEGDTLFVGLDIGLSIYRLAKREVKETYRHLGRKFPAELGVKALVLFGKEIWVATKEGTASSRLDHPNLLDPDAWTDYTTADGLPQNSIVDFTLVDGELAAAALRQVVVFRNGRWQPVGTGFPDAEVFDLTLHQDKLVSVTSEGIYVLQSGAWIRYGSAIEKLRCAVSTPLNLWSGTDEGLAVYSDAQSIWAFYRPNGPASHLFSDLAVDQNGVLWCASANVNGAGFYRFDGSQWTNYSTRSDPPTALNDAYSVAVDRHNAKWIGTWGRGVLYWDEESPFRYYNKANGKLGGIVSDPDYAVASQIAVDTSGTVWILNFETITNLPLVSVTPDSVWTRYGLPTTLCKRIAVDLENRKWIGSENMGVIVYDDNGTPADRSDDPPVEIYSTDDGLASNQITDLAVDRDGVVWIGTPAGLFYYENGRIKQRYGALSDNVTRLLVDGANNLWVGTGSGLSCFLVRDYAWMHFHTQNSGLVENGITALAMDYSSGKLYVGTSLGLSVLETPFSEPLPELAELKVYPNPFLPSQHETVTIDNLASGVSVAIFGADGYRVRHYSDSDIFGKQLFWDGLSDTGNPVSAGIYVVVVQDESGARRLGKVALIR